MIIIYCFYRGQHWLGSLSISNNLFIHNTCLHQRQLCDRQPWPLLLHRPSWCIWPHYLLHLLWQHWTPSWWGLSLRQGPGQLCGSVLVCKVGYRHYSLPDKTIFISWVIFQCHPDHTSSHSAISPWEHQWWYSCMGCQGLVQRVWRPPAI